MDWPPVYQLCRQAHRWVSASGRDKRWKHLSAKPATRLDFPWGSLQTTTLIGCRCKHSNMFSRAVLIARELFFSPPWTKKATTGRVLSDTSKFYTTRNITCFNRTSVKILLFLYIVQRRTPIFRRLIALGFHLFPFRTEKLSPTAPMVLQRFVGE